ncbi:MAG: prepilin-type N-terminal cleavage/methylation domain-containing protein, partial [Burkholderiales bacterium]|nr:prepilin-type N-terminal cleavage/methylation domain-containing protein [Burkholderiales bacterium]
MNPNPVDHREKSGILAVAAPSARGFTLIEIMIVVVILA